MIGGDFYDFFRLADERMGLVVADVSGKGVPAALFMMVSRTLMKGTAIGESNPAKCLKEVNELLAESNEEAMFVTVFYTNLDPMTGHLEFANAGHNLPFVVKPSGEVRQIDCAPGLVLGVLPDFEFPEAEPSIWSRETCCSTTPTASTRRWTTNGVEFGDERLTGVLAEAAGSSAADFSRRVVEAVHAHAGEAPQSDDITCMTLRYLGDAS